MKNKSEGARMKLTINEIARLARVAKSTVSKALNGRKGVSEEKRQLIMSLAEKLKFQPSTTAKALASSRSGTIGLVLPHEAGFSLSGVYWSAIITSVAREAHRNKSNLLILSPDLDDDISAPIETALRHRSVDGLIVGSEALDKKSVSMLVLEEMPFVLLGRNPGIHHYAVDVDNRYGAVRMVKHLIGKGYRKIGCLAGPEDYLYTKERIEGYGSALEQAGISWSAVEYSEYSTSSTETAVRKLVSKHADLDALFITAGGEFVLDALDALRKMDFRLEGIGLGAFDDYRFFDYLGVKISTVRQPMPELGTEAALMLFKLIEGREIPEAAKILPTDLILR